MTTQEAYERIREHFSQPDAEFSVTENNICRYRGPNGAKCAFGVLIENDEYRLEMEGAGATSVMRTFNLPNLVGVDENFVEQAQETHDKCAQNESLTTADFVDRLDVVAYDHRLKVAA